MKLDLKENKLKLEYPAQWTYKLIGRDREAIEGAVSEIVKGRSEELLLSNKSKTGKYTCLNLDLTVQNEEERNSIFEQFKKHPGIVMVL